MLTSAGAPTPAVGEVPRPVDTGRTLRELGHAHHVVLLLVVAQVGRRPADLRDLCLEILHAPGARPCVVESGDREQPRDVGDLRLPYRRIGFIEVELARAQRQAARLDADDGLADLVAVEVHADDDRLQQQPAVTPGEEVDQLLTARDGGNRVQLRLDRREPGSLDRSLVHERRVPVAHLLLVAALRGLGVGRRLLEDCPGFLQRLVLQCSEAAGLELVGRYLGAV